MDRTNRERWQIRAAALVIFALGFLAGGLSLNYYSLHRASAPPHGGRMMGRGRFEQVFNRLNLTEDQKVQMDKILTETRAQLDDIHKEMQPRVDPIRNHARERMREVLTPEQWQEFQQTMKAGRERHRDRQRPAEGGAKDKDEE